MCEVGEIVMKKFLAKNFCPMRAVTLAAFAMLALFALVGCAGSAKESASAEVENVSSDVFTNAPIANASGVQNVVEPVKQHFFWKVSDSNSTVWVLGSVHFADSSFYPLDSAIETAFVNAEELAVEIDISDDSVSNDVAQKSMEQGLLPAGTTLNQILPRPMWTSLDSICAAWNFPIAGLMRMKPWFAATTLSVVAIQRMGIDPSLGVDAVLLDRAATDGKAIVSLESAEEQVGALADTSDSDSSGVYYLKATLREISGLDSMVTQMIRAWKTGDDALLRKVMNEDTCDSLEDGCDAAEDKAMREHVEEKVYTSRNAKMAESIAKFLAEDRNVFVVVGAAHLALDDDNVIELLRRRGLTIERF